MPPSVRAFVLRPPKIWTWAHKSPPSRFLGDFRSRFNNTRAWAWCVTTLVVNLLLSSLRWKGRGPCGLLRTRSTSGSSPPLSDFSTSTPSRFSTIASWASYPRGNKELLEETTVWQSSIGWSDETVGRHFMTNRYRKSLETTQSILVERREVKL